MQRYLDLERYRLFKGFSDVITLDFSIREIVLHVLTLFANNGFTKLLRVGDII